ncbi:hypothetical protein GOODEAATRI_008522 [Goodea atripinnis]|uniref:Ig-like domain-containing protein n=1 Tax=Goodea atripinnis TaxID=208336 RepID=A0ABV0NIJ1_9TELE
MLLLLRVASLFGLFTCVNAPLELRVKSGDDASLQCQAPDHSEIIMVEWTLSKLPPGENVVFFWHKDKGVTSEDQNQAYRGRVELKDAQMTDGNVSVKLKNVSIDDSGTYKCKVVKKTGQPPEPVSTIIMTVRHSDTAGIEGKTRNTAERTKNMASGLGLLLLAACCLCFS